MKFCMTINKNQRGYTLLEVLVATAITGLIVAGLTTAIFQISDVNAMSRARMAAIKEVENAVSWISLDAQSAQTISTTSPSGFPLTLSWVDWDNTSTDISYSVQDGQLHRSQSINGEEPINTVIIPHVNSEQQMTNCQFSMGVLTLKITATINGFRTASETRYFNITPRPST